MKTMPAFTLLLLAALAVDARAERPAPRTSAWKMTGAGKLAGKRIQLTPDQPNQVGAAWYSGEIDLQSDFDLRFRVFLGKKDADGADGIVFVLAPDLAAAELGQGLGYQGISPSLAVELDTHPNDGQHLGDDLGDPLEDHLAIDAGGSADHRNSKLPRATVGNLEDGREHTLELRWSASKKTLEVFLDDLAAPKLTYREDIVRKHLQGRSRVRFGFTGATGELANPQYFVPVALPAPSAATGELFACEWKTGGSAKRSRDRLQLTADTPDQVGAAWCKTEIDLAADLDLQFQVYLGKKDDDGADGIVFVLAPEVAAAEVGQGLGYQGISPSLAVELDTHPNDGEHIGDDLGDPLEDHLAIDAGGSADHKNRKLPRAQVSNLEDGHEHTLVLRWSASKKTLEVFLDDLTAPKLTYREDIVRKHLQGKGRVRFGFTGATGQLSNLQWIAATKLSRTPRR